MAWQADSGHMVKTLMPWAVLLLIVVGIAAFAVFDGQSQCPSTLERCELSKDFLGR